MSGVYWGWQGLLVPRGQKGYRGIRGIGVPRGVGAIWGH